MLKSVKEEAAKGRSSSSSRRRRNGSLEKLRWYNTARQGRELKELGGVEYNKKRDSILLSLSLFLSLYLLNVRAKNARSVKGDGIVYSMKTALYPHAPIVDPERESVRVRSCVYVYRCPAQTDGQRHGSSID